MNRRNEKHEQTKITGRKNKGHLSTRQHLLVWPDRARRDLALLDCRAILMRRFSIIADSDFY
jgi:hypothetical protein